MSLFSKYFEVILAIFFNKVTTYSNNKSYYCVEKMIIRYEEFA